MNHNSRSESYAAAGVDITAGYRAVELMKSHIARTMTAGVCSDIGGFGGLFELDTTGIEHPVLVSGTDGVGTKLKLAFLMDKHDTVGIDCVAMCVNDIICCGAKPLLFLDYIACGKNVPERIAEIVSGVVQIKSIAREPGARSKVAVASRERNLDPVGACVGPKGSRVRMVVEELRNERVDVIQWNEDPAVYVANALSPAKVTKVIIDEENNYATVVVPDDQLSLAIGKEGQNARLAARLTGWHIDIKSASFAGAPLRNENILIDEDEIEDDEEGLCAFEDEDGNRCRNHARPNSRFCGIHAEMEDAL